MAIDSLTLRTAEKYVENYNRESADLLAAHREAMDCRDCEVFLELGIDAFRWVILADAAIRGAVAEGKLEFTPEIDAAIKHLCERWLVPCKYAEEWIAIQQARGYQIDNLDRFRECCGEMRAIVEAQAPRNRESLPAAVAELRDQAIREHRSGQTAEFV